MNIKQDFVLDPYLVLYLPLYQLDGSSFMSRDAYGHLGTVTGAIWSRQGRMFDGSDDDITVPYNTAFALSELSVEMWFYSTDLTGNHELVSKGTTGSVSFILMTSAAYVYFYVGGVQQANAAYKDISINTWYHAVGTHDGSNTRLYLNGVWANAAATPLAPATNQNNVYIGQRSDNSNHFKGTAGSLRIYSHALTPFEIQRNYLATKWRYQ